MAAFRTISDSKHLRSLLEASREAPIVLFKHSATCSLSAEAYEEMAKLDTDVHLVVVQENRPISNEIESVTGIRHESPQVIILKDGKPYWNASHRKVQSKAVDDALNTALLSSSL